MCNPGLCQRFGANQIHNLSAQLWLANTKNDKMREEKNHMMNGVDLYLEFFEKLPKITNDDLDKATEIITTRRTLTPRQSLELTKIGMRYAGSSQ